MKKKLLVVENLEACIGSKKIIDNLTLTIYENEIHLLMGPNGSGKSTFSKILVGHPSCGIVGGNIQYKGENLFEKEIETRAQEGLFLAFQSPLEIAGVTNYDFLRTIYNQKQTFLKEPELDPLEFQIKIQPLLKKLKMNQEFLTRNLNEGFSGGEKKRNEILQMLLLRPKLIILDEIDSGLDIDAIKTIFEEILKNKKEMLAESSLLVITHNPKVLTYLIPDYVHIMMEGKIVKTGNLDLVNQIETYGYQSIV